MEAGAAFGPWLLDERLGVGGMGEVWLATHRVLERRIAVKILTPELTRDPRLRERFISEARVQARLSHPHIAQIQDFVEEDGRFAILMEWIPGGTVADAIDRASGPMPIERTLKWAGQALEALDYAHRHGVIHRDVKPSNLMLDGSGDIKVADFGIAVAMGVRRVTTTGKAVGTPQYMSPEQILRPQSVDHRTDVYSLGIVLYEMLAGRVPFDADTDYTLLKLQVEAAPPPLRSLNPLVPEWLESVVLRCLAKSPDDRFAGCASVAEALSQRPSPTAPAVSRAAERSAHAPTEPTEPGRAAVGELALEPPRQRSQPGAKSRSKRAAALVASGVVAIALASAWWWTRPKPRNVPGNPPAPVEQGKRAPVPAPPVPAATETPPAAEPPDRELSKLRNSIAAAIRAKDWPRASPLIDSLLAKLPTDPEALGWRKLLTEGRKSDLLGKPSREEPNDPEVAKVTPSPAPAAPATPPLSPPAAPAIAQFVAGPASIERGQTSTLRWQVTGSVTSVSINHGVGAVQNTGTSRVQPDSSTSYTLTATGPGGATTASANINVTIPPPLAPVIAQFTAEPASIQRGQTSELRWQAAGPLTSVSISQGVGAVRNTGTRRVQPDSSTTYTLTATGPGGATTASASINVTMPPPLPPPPTAQQSELNVVALDSLPSGSNFGVRVEGRDGKPIPWATVVLVLRKMNEGGKPEELERQQGPTGEAGQLVGNFSKLATSGRLEMAVTAEFGGHRVIRDFPVNHSSRQSELTAQCQKLAGAWIMRNPAETSPHWKIRPFVTRQWFSVTRIDLTLSPDGTGKLNYVIDVGKTGRRPDVAFGFQMGEWDGTKLSGVWAAEGATGVISITPSADKIILQWEKSKDPGNRFAIVKSAADTLVRLP
jgi:serine/threonine-protein kinase